MSSRTQGSQVPGPCVVLRERLERLCVLPPVLEMLFVDGKRRIDVGELLVNFADAHQLMRFAVGERPQQDAVHDREHGGRGAESRRSRGMRGDRQSGQAVRPL